MAFQLLLRDLEGRTRCLLFSSETISGDTLLSRVTALVAVPPELQRIVSGTREITPESHLSASSDGLFPGCNLVVRVRGGKGGFGSLLRGAATKAGQKKTNNFDACRDMSGRRLRHVNAEKKLREWKAQAADRDLERAAQDFLKNQVKKTVQESTASRDLENYRAESSKAMEEVEIAVRNGLTEAKRVGLIVDAKRKKVNSMGSDRTSPSKRPCLRLVETLGLEEDSEGTDDDDDDDDDDGKASDGKGNSSDSGGSEEREASTSRSTLDFESREESPTSDSRENATSLVELQKKNLASHSGCENRVLESEAKGGIEMFTFANNNITSEMIVMMPSDDSEAGGSVGEAETQGKGIRANFANTEKEEIVTTREHESPSSNIVESKGIGFTFANTNKKEMIKTEHESPSLNVESKGITSCFADTRKMIMIEHSVNVEVEGIESGFVNTQEMIKIERKSSPSLNVEGKEVVSGFANTNTQEIMKIEDENPSSVNVGGGGVSSINADVLNFDEFNTAEDLMGLGAERLKRELLARGLKCGGTIKERTARLFLLKDTKLENLDKKHFAKGK